MQGSGKSSESYWTPFDSVTTALTRKVRGKVWIAWTRVADVSNYAIVGSSLVGGTDIVQGSGETSLNAADSFSYFDETDKTLRIEYERTLIEPLGGIQIALFDVLLDNTDLRFTPTVSATIGTAIKPNRPLKIFIGFEINGVERMIPIIEGLTLQPRENKNNRTVVIQGFDYIHWLDKQKVESAIYTNQRSDQIIADILANAGIGDSSYELDQGLNTVGFAWFEKGHTVGERLRKLAESEEGIFFQDETGKLRFENRDKYSQVPYNANVWTIDPEDIIEWREDTSSKIVNRAEISGSPRSVKTEAEVWRNGIEEEIPPGTSKTIWASFEDPVTNLTDPSDHFDYTAYSATGGSGSDITNFLDIEMTEFTKAAKLVITNNHGSSTAFINFMRLRGTPATVDYTVEEIFQDTVSIDEFTENTQKLDSDFIDSRSFAQNMAKDLVRRHKDPNNVIILHVQGIPQLQLRDRIRVKDQDLGTYTDYRLIGIQGILEGASFTQKLRLRKITENEAK